MIAINPENLYILSNYTLFYSPPRGKTLLAPRLEIALIGKKNPRMRDLSKEIPRARDRSRLRTCRDE